MGKIWTAAAMGRKGGKISKRKLTPDEARAMVRAREIKRAARLQMQQAPIVNANVDV
jgi:hypothetical protein